MKPLCKACGHSNPLDSKFCLECGVLLNYQKTIADGMELFLEEKNNLLPSAKELAADYIGCEHDLVLNNYKCRCTKCADCQRKMKICEDHKLEDLIKKNSQCLHKFVVGNTNCNCMACRKCDIIKNPCEKHKPEKLFTKQEAIAALYNTNGINAVFDDKKQTKDKSQFANEQIMKMLSATMERINVLEKYATNDNNIELPARGRPKTEIDEESRYERDYRKWKQIDEIPQFIPEGNMIKVPHFTPEQRKKMIEKIHDTPADMTYEPSSGQIKLELLETQVKQAFDINNEEPIFIPRPRPKKQNLKEYITIGKKSNKNLHTAENEFMFIILVSGIIAFIFNVLFV